jgi:hypothetical protein
MRLTCTRGVEAPRVPGLPRSHLRVAVRRCATSPSLAAHVISTRPKRASNSLENCHEVRNAEGRRDLRNPCFNLRVGCYVRPGWWKWKRWNRRWQRAWRRDIGDDVPWRPGLKSDKCDARQNGRQNGHARGRRAPDVTNRGCEPRKERTLRHSYAVTRRAWRNR